MEREVKMGRRQLEREIDVALAAKIECEKKGQTVLAALHGARVEKLAKKLEEAELG